MKIGFVWLMISYESGIGRLFPLRAACADPSEGEGDGDVYCKGQHADLLGG